MDRFEISAMNKYLLVLNVGVILILFSCVGSSASAQSMAQSANTSMSSSTNMTISQAIQVLSCHLRVCLTTPQTIPSFVQVNDAIGLMVGVINNSPRTITYNDICLSPITAIFDNHVTVQHTIRCFVIGPMSIPPHGHGIVHGPPSGTVYRANSPAFPAYGVIKFTYRIVGSTGLFSVFRPFEFNIFP